MVTDLLRYVFVPENNFKDLSGLHIKESVRQNPPDIEAIVHIKCTLNFYVMLKVRSSENLKYFTIHT